MRNPHLLTAGQASKEANVSKTTISKALKSGRLSYVEKTSSGYKIDPAELFRVFPKPLGLQLPVNTSEPQGNHVKIAKLEAEREALQKEISDLRHSLNRAEENADQWREQAQRLAITHEQKASFWQKIFKR